MRVMPSGLFFGSVTLIHQNSTPAVFTFSSRRIYGKTTFKIVSRRPSFSNVTFIGCARLLLGSALRKDESNRLGRFLMILSCMHEGSEAEVD